MQSAIVFREGIRSENGQCAGNREEFTERRRGATFSRGHRASARGERLAVDSGNLVNNALRAERTGDSSARTYIDESVAPYAQLQQDDFDRQVMTDADRAEAQAGI
jgi:hypothetical protein